MLHKIQRFAIYKTACRKQSLVLYLHEIEKKPQLIIGIVNNFMFIFTIFISLMYITNSI